MPRGTSNTISGTRDKTKKQAASKRGGSTSPPTEKKAKLISQAKTVSSKKLVRKVAYEKKTSEVKGKQLVTESEKNKRAEKEDGLKKISEDKELQKQKGTKDVSKISRKRKAEITLDETKDSVENLKEDKSANKQLLKKRGRFQKEEEESDVKEESGVQLIEKVKENKITKENKKDAKIEAGVYATRSNRRSASLDRENVKDKLQSIEVETKLAFTKNKGLQKNELASGMQEIKTTSLSESQKTDMETVIDMQQNVDVADITGVKMGNDLQKKSKKVSINESKTRTTRQSECNISGKEKFTGKKQQNIDVKDSPDIEICGELLKSQGKMLPKVTKTSSERQAGNYISGKSDVSEKLQSVGENKVIKSRTTSSEKKELNLVSGQKKRCTTRAESCRSEKEIGINEKQSDIDDKNANDITADCKLLKGAEKLDTKMLKARNVRVGSYSSDKESDLSDMEQRTNIKDTVSSKMDDELQKKEKKVMAIVHKTRQAKGFKSISSKGEGDVNEKQHTLNLKDIIDVKTDKAVQKSKEKSGENMRELRYIRRSESFSSERESDFNEAYITQMKETTIVRTDKKTQKGKGKDARETRSTRRSESFSSERESDINEKFYIIDVKDTTNIRTNKDMQKGKGKMTKSARETRSTRRSESFSSERESDINEKSSTMDIKDTANIKTEKEMQKSKGRMKKNARETRSTKQSESFSSERESDINEKAHSTSIEDIADVRITKVIQKSKGKMTKSRRETRSARQSKSFSSERESDINEKQENLPIRVDADDKTKNKQQREEKKLETVEVKPWKARRSKSFSSERVSDVNAKQTSMLATDTVNDGVKTEQQRKEEKLGSNELKQKKARSKSFSSEREYEVNEKQSSIHFKDATDDRISDAQQDKKGKIETCEVEALKTRQSKSISSDRKSILINYL